MNQQRTFLRRRGVEVPCNKCHGLGTYTYPSTATWRGGIGGAAMTIDICDVCWGTGDAHRIGTDIRELEAKRAAWNEEQALSYLSRRFLLNIGRIRLRLRQAGDGAAAQSRKRKIPKGEDEFHWRRDWEAVAHMLRSLGKETTND